MLLKQRPANQKPQARPTNEDDEMNDSSVVKHGGGFIMLWAYSSDSSLTNMYLIGGEKKHLQAAFSLFK